MRTFLRVWPYHRLCDTTSESILVENRAPYALYSMTSRPSKVAGFNQGRHPHSQRGGYTYTAVPGPNPGDLPSIQPSLMEMNEVGGCSSLDC